MQIRYIPITNLNYIVDNKTYYTIDGSKPELLSGWQGISYKEMKKKYKSIKFFSKETAPRFKTDKPYPFGY